MCAASCVWCRPGTFFQGPFATRAREIGHRLMSNQKCENDLQAYGKNSAPLANPVHRKGSPHHRNHMEMCSRSHRNTPMRNTLRRPQPGSRHRRCRSLHQFVLEGDPHSKWSQRHQPIAHQHYIVRTRRRKTTKAKRSENAASLSPARVLPFLCAQEKSLQPLALMSVTRKTHGK